MSPGWVVRGVAAEAGADEDLAAIALAEAYAAAGACATDVETVDRAHVAYGLFTCRPAMPVDRQLPPAEAIALPDLERRPVVLGGVEIRAPEDPPVGDGPSLSIDHAGAWGGGLHPTTAMMLTLAARGPAGPRVLDVGTGTGILALAQLARGATGAVGTDVAAAALRSARANAARNRLMALAVQADLPPGRFDVVLANLRAAIIEDLAERLASAVAEQGRLLVSGIRFYEDLRVEQALGAVGLSAQHRLFSRGWWCLSFSE